MRYLRTQVLNRRSPQDQRLYVDVTNAVVMNTPNNLTLPVGTTAQRPVSPTNGMIRYNTDISTAGQVEIYQSSKWRSLRFKEATQITQQTLGVGDSNNVYFGPLSSAYSPSNISSDVTSFGGQNIIVVVENVIQLFNTNYTIVQNPTVGAQTYSPRTSVSTSIGSTNLYFSTSIYGLGATGDGTYVTITYPAQASVPFRVGESITVDGFNPSAYNGVYTVTAATTTQVQFASTYNNPMLVAGTITSNYTQFPSVNITGATVTGTNIQDGTVVQSYATDSSTGALTRITISKPTITGTIASGTQIDIAEGSQSGNGYYLQFSSAVPYGKSVTVLIGFDQ